MRHIKTFEAFISKAGGRDAGKHEISTTTLETAIKLMEDNDFFQYIDKDEFAHNFEQLKKLAKLGHTKRKDMPVLSGNDVKLFAEKLKEDGIESNIADIPAYQLKPIQEQIYFDECMLFLKHGLGGAIALVQKMKTSVVSKDKFIIDGHHRWGFAMLFAPKTEFKCLVIDLEIKKLLKTALEFGDSLGNQRNK